MLFLERIKLWKVSFHLLSLTVTLLPLTVIAYFAINLHSFDKLHNAKNIFQTILCNNIKYLMTVK